MLLTIRTEYRPRRSSSHSLEAAFKCGGAHLVDVPIDYWENIRVPADELRNRSASNRPDERATVELAFDRGLPTRDMTQEKM
ncbi:hypothetical protein [Bradyrhizobium neotropicale]|uniref:hypothetical protein n=1 Tax=Bradyrhizobium neotropicale TaxID=1497615 RepID=UPI001AD66A22|nr:hypothetical protein [Bradyrhizobium neotropicale]MBO4228544.1 hypothetical protein [Bradyrhizobium neotropicale]